MAPALAFFLGWIASSILLWVGGINRLREEKTDEQFAEAAAPHKLYWRVTHMRDDVSAIALLLAVTNGLLAAILAALIK